MHCIAADFFFSSTFFLLRIFHHLFFFHSAQIDVFLIFSPGGILVFLTGRREIEEVCAKLRRKYEKLGMLAAPHPRPTSAPTKTAAAAAVSTKAGKFGGKKPFSKTERLCTYCFYLFIYLLIYFFI